MLPEGTTFRASLVSRLRSKRARFSLVVSSYTFAAGVAIVCAVFFNDREVDENSPEKVAVPEMMGEPGL